MHEHAPALAPETLLALEIEAIPYETAVEACLTRLQVAEGTPRGQQLYNAAKILVENLDTPGKLASIAAMALVMLHEERKRNEPGRGTGGSP